MSLSVEKTKNMWDILRENSTRYYKTMAYALEYVGLQLAPTTYQPDSIIAGLPVYNLQHEGHAASDELLKYRSIGTIFLAHQKGGKRTYRCTLLIEGPARLYVLAFLQRLQRLGIQQDLTINEFTTLSGLEIPPSVEEPFIPPSANDKIRYIHGYQHVGKEMIAYHKTCPIITDTKIYTNMYLETLRYTEDIKIGAEVMQIDCAFREFIPPMHIRWYKGNADKKERGYFATWLTDEERSALRRIDLLINSMWAFRSYFEETLHPDIQQKQSGQYNIEGAILAVGALLAASTIWSK